jgi:hypothetical protein
VGRIGSIVIPTVETAVPFHPARDISPTLLRVIARDIGLNVRDFVDGR